LGHTARLKRQRFVQHSQTSAHLFAESFIKNGDVDDDGRVPPFDHWESVYQASLGAGATSKDGVATVGQRRKVRRMQWCLAEAKRYAARCALKSAESISIQEDKRATRFLMRYKCCSAKLEVSSGVLCLSREVGDIGLNGADKLRAATL
jgi:hypothetical protein